MEHVQTIDGIDFTLQNVTKVNKKLAVLQVSHMNEWSLTPPTVQVRTPTEK